MMKTTLKAVVALHLLIPGWVLAVDLSQVPKIHETAAQCDERMQWFRDAKFGSILSANAVIEISSIETKADTPHALMLQRVTVYGVK